MTIQRQLLNRAAICTTAMIDENTFKIPQDDLDSSNIEVGDTVNIALTRVDVGTDIKPDDRAIFKSVVAPNGMIVIPNDVKEDLKLEPEDKVKFVAIPEKAIPGPGNGPLRERINGGNGEEQVERPERQSLEATFSGKKMRQTGQIKVPGEVLDELGLIQGDDVAVLVEHDGLEATQKATIGSSNRITIRKKTREELNIDDPQGVQPTISVQVLD